MLKKLFLDKHLVFKTFQGVKIDVKSLRFPVLGISIPRVAYCLTTFSKIVGISSQSPVLLH